MDTRKHPANKGITPSSSILGSRGMVAGLILILAIIAVVAIIIATSNPGASPAVLPQTCGMHVLNFVNANLAQAGSTAKLENVTEKSGVYEIWVRYLGRDVSLYATKDCTLLFPSALALTGNQSSAAQPETTTAQPTPTASSVKSTSPVVDLFVMAFCPYGTQAESAMQPVENLLGSKANITVRYIASVQGTTTGSVSSLHGPSEAMEDLRQLCIKQDFPPKFWQYLIAFNRDCYPIWQNATQLDACRRNTMQALGIDAQKIETCANGVDGLGLLKADETFSNTHNAQASPTLIINGQVYSGQRTPEAYKQAICANFKTAPAECIVNLSAQVATVAGSCG
ncbi:MAG: DsbA family protein [Methanomicrobiales archaeon]|nr:DsbA family protein [Methanomicrobiales archaeon]